MVVVVEMEVLWVSAADKGSAAGLPVLSLQVLHVFHGRIVWSRSANVNKPEKGIRGLSVRWPHGSSLCFGCLCVALLNSFVQNWGTDLPLLAIRTLTVLTIEGDCWRLGSGKTTLHLLVFVIKGPENKLRCSGGTWELKVHVRRNCVDLK